MLDSLMGYCQLSFQLINLLPQPPNLTKLNRSTVRPFPPPLESITLTCGLSWLAPPASGSPLNLSDVLLSMLARREHAPFLSASSSSSSARTSSLACSWKRSSLWLCQMACLALTSLLRLSRWSLRCPTVGVTAPVQHRRSECWSVRAWEGRDSPPKAGARTRSSARTYL